MTCLRHAALAAASLACAAPAVAQAEVATIQLPAPWLVTGHLALDLDHDGRLDLVLALHDATNQRRALQVHRRAASGAAFASTPSEPLLLVDSDVISFTAADALPGAGRELVLLTAERIVAVGRDGDGNPTYTALGAQRSLWPAPDREALQPLATACCDLDRDGHDDLLLPQPDGALLVLHAAQGEASQRSVIELPAWQSPIAAAGAGPAQLRGDTFSLQLGGGGGAEADETDRTDDDAAPNGGTPKPDRAKAAAQPRGPLVRLRSRTPAFSTIDVDGDGRDELVALRNLRLWITASAPGAAPSERVLPLPADRLTLFDPSFDVQFRRIDGDARPDLLLTSSATRNDEIEVRLDLFRSRADGSWPEQPDSRLRTQPLAGPPQLVDVDGDGVLDLVATTLRTDLLRNLASGELSALDVQLNVFRGTGERFVQPGLANLQLRLPAKANRGGPPFVRVVPGGDGRPAALLRRANEGDGDGLLRQPFERDGNRLRLGAVTARLRLADDAKVRPLLVDGDELLVLQGQDVLHVRLR
jgi:hypothetical protein